MEKEEILKKYSFSEIYKYYKDYKNHKEILRELRKTLDSNDWDSITKTIDVLEEYEELLKNIDGIDSKKMMEEILNQIHTVRFKPVEEKTAVWDESNDFYKEVSIGVKHENNGELIVDTRNSSVKTLRKCFTDIAFQNKETTSDEEMEYKNLDKLRNDYIVRKLSGEKVSSFADSQCMFDRLVAVFGEDIMLNLNSENLKLVKDCLLLKGIDLKRIEYLLGMQEVLWMRQPLRDLLDVMNKEHSMIYRVACYKEYDKFLKDNPELLPYYDTIMKDGIFNSISLSYNINDDFDKVRNEKVKAVVEEIKVPDEFELKVIKDFIIELDSIEDFSPEFKKSLVLNITKNVKDLHIAWEKPYNKNKAFHEIITKACISKNEFGEIQREGFFDASSKKGRALNEAVAIFLANKISKNDLGYKSPELENIMSNIINLYGEGVVFDSYINGSTKLEELMQKDGKNLMEFKTLTDNYQQYYIEDYEKLLNKSRNSSKEYETLLLESKFYRSDWNDSYRLEKYYQVGTYIDDIKQTRGLEKEPSNWKKNDVVKNYIISKHILQKESKEDLTNKVVEVFSEYELREMQKEDPIGFSKILSELGIDKEFVVEKKSENNITKEENLENNIEKEEIKENVTKEENLENNIEKEEIIDHLELEEVPKGNKFFNRIKEFFGKIKDRFSFKKQQLLLPEGENEFQNEVNKMFEGGPKVQNEFREGLKIENFRSEYDSLSLHEELNLQESKDKQNKEKEDFGER